jgi:hypothetical protein
MQRTRRLYFLLFGLTGAIAVGAFWWQLPGLSGSSGITPAADYLSALHRAPGVGFFEVPTLAWLSSSDWLLHALCAIAFLSSLCLAAYLAPRLAALALWAAWLSLTLICHPWLDFQWDLLLVELAFCSSFFAPPGLRPGPDAPPPGLASRLVLQLLACKLTLESGLVKLASGDSAWRDLTALTWHWWTQPLPTWTSQLAAALPLEVQRVLCALMFVFELPIPLLALGPRAARLISAGGMMALQVGLFAAGNYSYYNLLTFVLAVPLLDDAALAWLTGRRWSAPLTPAAPPRAWQLGLVALYAGTSVLAFAPRLTHERGALFSRLHAFETVNAYGAFAVMTRSRPELLLEGSADGHSWQRYELPWKPGDLTRRPRFVAPWQPRLDWQLWFAALGDCSASPWVLALQHQLLLGTPAVLALFEHNPFPAAPPAYLRTRISEYRFAPWREAGVWWSATETGPFCPPVTLGPERQLIRAPEGPP